MSFVLIYLLGVISCYILIRYVRKEYFNNSWSWVIVGALCSMGSWFMFSFILFIVAIVYLISLLDSEPPKWL
jgi:uncharacterized membrane protein